MPLTILRDGDIELYRVALRYQDSFDFEDGEEPVIKTDLEGAINELDERLSKLQKTLKADDLVVCLSDSSHNWRKDIYPDYKNNRDPAAKPLLIPELREYVMDNYWHYLKPSLEADDIMGILSTHPALIKGKKIIVSEDKDLKTVPGWLFNPDKDEKPWKVSTRVADYHHLLQTLTGDVTDGYPGCPGVGPVNAVEFFKSPYRIDPYVHTFKSGPRKGETETRYKKTPVDNYWEGIVSLFVRAGLTEEDALTQARIARICRYTDYNFKTKEVKLWLPDVP